MQEYTLLSVQAFGNLFRKPFYGADLITQSDSIGVGSLPIVILTGFFTGGVLALQSASTLAQFGAKAVTGELVSLSMIKELGPVLTGLMLTGRNASGMASELGSMKVSEQIDAMRALGTDPVKKLVTPRVIATIVMSFFLTIISDLVGIAGGGAVSISMLGLDASQYFHNAYQTLQYPDIIQGLLKPVFFGFIISTVGCFFGMNAGCRRCFGLHHRVGLHHQPHPDRNLWTLRTRHARNRDADSRATGALRRSRAGARI